MTTPEQSAVNTDGQRAATAQFGDAPSSPESRDPKAIDLDDLGWDVPDEDAESDASDEYWNPDDDSDLGLEEDDEEIGLDTDTGFEEGSDDFELDESGEGERWTTDSEAEAEAEAELPGTEADVISGEEYGWTGDDDQAEPDEDLDAELEESLPQLDDGGAEGVDDDSELEDFELGRLPDLDATEDDGDAFGIESIEEMTGVSLAEEPTFELLPGHVWKQLRASAVRVHELASLPGPASALEASGGRVLACAGDALLLAERDGLTRAPAPPGGGRALALTTLEGRLVVALATPQGLALSQDAGRSFERVRDDENIAQLGLTQTAGTLRIWLRNLRGGLLVSDDLGRSFTPTRLEGQLLQFAADGDRRLAALVKRGTRTLLGCSSDTGRRWSWADAAEGGALAEPRLIAGRSAALIAAPTSVLHALAGQPPRVVAALLHGPATLLEEDDESFVYACATRDGETLLARCGTRGGAQPLLIASLPHARYGAPRQLTATFAEGGFVTLHVATDRSLLRIEASLDGDDLP